MEELFTILSSSARLNKKKSKTKSSKNTTAIASNNTRDEVPTIEPNVIPETKKNERTIQQQEQIHQESVAAFRRKLNIKVKYSGTSLEDPMVAFEDLSAPSWYLDEKKEFDVTKRAICSNILQGNWINPTPIQMQCIPTMIHSRVDVMACAPTGSGKSGAFLIPTLFLSSAPSHVFYHHQHTSTTNDATAIRALILAPSRELASQLHREVVRLSFGRKISSSLFVPTYKKNGLDILVSTPLRLVSSSSDINLSHVRIIVMDEADRLLDATDGGKISSISDDQQKQKLEESSPDGCSDGDSNTSDDDSSTSSSSTDGSSSSNQDNNNNNNNKSGGSHVPTFLEQMDRILAEIPKTAIRALFSATMGQSVQSLAESILRQPLLDVQVNGGGISSTVEQELLFCGKEEGKLLAMKQLLAQGGIKPPILLFLQNKQRAQALYHELQYLTTSTTVDVLHAGRSQAARDAAVQKFRMGETWIMICTDLCARGVDLKAVNMVINYDLPTSAVTYIHRIGRCGRAGRSGKAITFFTESDFPHLRSIANVMKLSGCTNIPQWMLQHCTSSSSKYKNAKQRAEYQRRNPKRHGIDTTPIYDKRKQWQSKQQFNKKKNNKNNIKRKSYESKNSPSSLKRNKTS